MFSLFASMDTSVISKSDSLPKGKVDTGCWPAGHRYLPAAGKSLQNALDALWLRVHWTSPVYESTGKTDSELALESSLSDLRCAKVLMKSLPSLSPVLDEVKVWSDA